MKLENFDINTLKKQLKEVQKRGNEFKLSERSIVDILSKIAERGKIFFNYTQNGKEYVTNEKISKEILDSIKINGGIISKISLTKIIDVNQNVIDNQLDKLLNLTGVNGINIIEGKIVTNYYLNNICNEINTILQNEGVVSLSELSNKFDFSIQFISKFLDQKINQGKIDAMLFPTRVITKEFIKVQKSLIRPILMASLQPFTLNLISDKYDVEEYLVKDLVQELIDENSAKGKLMNGMYIPDIYLTLQTNYLKSSLSRNGWIEYSNLENIGISQDESKNFISNIISNKSSNVPETKSKGKKGNKNEQKVSEIIEEGLFLNSIYIDESLKIRFESSFYENVFNGKITNVSQLLQIPIQFEEEEVLQLLKKLNFDIDKVNIIVSNIVPKAFIESIVNSDIFKKLILDEFSKNFSVFSQKCKEFRDKEQKRKLEEVKDKKSKKKEQPTNNFVFKYNGQNCLAEIKKVLKIMIQENNNTLENSNIFENEMAEMVKVILENKVIDKCFEEFDKEFHIQDTTDTKSKTSTNNQVSEDNVDYLQPEHLYYELKLINKSMNLIEKSDMSKSLNTFQTYYSKNHMLNFLKIIYQKEVQHMKLKINNELLTNFGVANKRQELINTLTDTEIKSIFSSLNENLKNINQFMNIFESKYKDLSISLLINEKKKEKQCIEKLFSKQSKILGEYKKDLGKSPKKNDYIQTFITYGTIVQLKENIYLPLPFENWSITLYQQIFKDILKSKVESKLKEIEEICSLIMSDKEMDFPTAERLASLFQSLDQ